VADFISVPFYDLLQENGHVPEIRKKLPALLAGIRRSILEIGAGTGLITTSLAGWTPAEIFALEPSAGMRAVLLSRLASRPELLERVTVLPGDGLSVDLDEPAEAVVMINVMYALEPGYRKRLWPVLAAQLEPGGLLVFTWRAGGPPAPHPLQEVASRRVGGIPTRFCRRSWSRMKRRSARATCTASPRVRRSSAKRRSPVTPFAPHGMCSSVN
jgi:SAM-dependent methyltransferase